MDIIQMQTTMMWVHRASLVQKKNIILHKPGKKKVLSYY
jgi:hypothetical protein